jgi:hypothetical protein
LSLLLSLVCFKRFSEYSRQIGAQTQDIESHYREMLNDSIHDSFFLSSETSKMQAQSTQLQREIETFQSLQQQGFDQLLNSGRSAAASSQAQTQQEQQFAVALTSPSLSSPSA